MCSRVLPGEQTCRASPAFPSVPATASAKPNGQRGAAVDGSVDVSGGEALDDDGTAQEADIVQLELLATDEEIRALPDNLPQPGDNLEGPSYASTFGHRDFEARAVRGYGRHEPSLLGISATDTLSPLSVFLHLFPWQFCLRVVIPQTKREGDPRWRVLTRGEFLRWIGVWLLMSCHPGVQDRRDHWSTDTPDPFSGTFLRLNKFMSRDRFEEILRHLRFWSAGLSMDDRFFKVSTASTFALASCYCLRKHVCRTAFR